MPLKLTFHESQYPERLAVLCQRALRARKLPGRLLYDSPAQAQRWLAYHQAYSPSRTEPELLALYERAFDAAIRLALQEQPLHYVSLGCGGGNKDALFVRHTLDYGNALHISPTDTSAALVLETMLRLQEVSPALSASPLVVDLAAEPDLGSWLAQQETDGARRVFGCFGIIPNFDDAALLSYLRRLMRPDDLLLISANLSPGPYGSAAAQRILPQYDNPLARAWFNGLLDSLGFAGSDLRLAVQARPLREDGHIWRIQADARVLQDVQLGLYEESFDFREGEVLEVFFSNRFTPAALPQVLDDAGFKVGQTWVLDSQEEGIYLCQRS
jgi:uncharacterized SAM-dependent methyltransferase